MTVRSSPSPNPSWAGPFVQDVSSKSIRCHCVPWLEPLSRYFQTAPVEIRVSEARAWDTPSARTTDNRPGQQRTKRFASERTLRLRIDLTAIRFGGTPLRQGTAACSEDWSVTVP